MARPKGVRFGKLEQDPELADRVVAQYTNGASLRDLACEHKIGWDALRAKLVERGVQIRSRETYLNNSKFHVPGGKPANGGLSDAEVARLRAAIGFDPSAQESAA